MRFRLHVGMTLAALLLFAVTSQAQFTKSAASTGTNGYIGPPTLTALTMQADVVVIGKIVDIDKNTVEASTYRGAPKDRRINYKIAVVKNDDPVIGGRGLTQFRVGFPDDSTPPNLRPLPVGGPVTPAVGLEGCYFLTRHHEGDFYILSSAIVDKKDKDYTKKLDEVKKVAKAIDDPVTALKAKSLDARYQAAQIILQRYMTNRSGRLASREAIPDEENKLILALLAELPWRPKGTIAKGATGTGTVTASAGPSRSALWYMINPQEFGYRMPKLPPSKVGELSDADKLMEESTSTFLKDNADKIKIKRFVR